MNALKNSRQLH